MSTTASRGSVASLRTQATLVMWSTPIAWAVLGGLSAAGSGKYDAVAGVAVVGFFAGIAIGWFKYIRLEAAAAAMECQADLLDAVGAMASQLPTVLAEQHAVTMEALRWIGERMDNSNTVNTELLRVVAENTDALGRLA
jgi:hypothetical protein